MNAPRKTNGTAIESTAAPAMTSGDIINGVKSGTLDAAVAIHMIDELIDRRVAELTAPADRPAGPQSWPSWFFSLESPDGRLVDKEEDLAKLPPGKWYTSPTHIGKPEEFSHFELS